MTPVVLQQYAPPSSYRRYPNRPRTYVGLHHTADEQGGAFPTPKAGSSWHRLFTADGIIRHAVPLDAAAHTILKTDKWRPPSIVRCPDGAVSDANYCGIQYEIEYAPQAPYNQVPNALQLASIKWQYQQDQAHFGVLPGIPHGMVQSDKWETEPHGLDYAQIGLVWHPGVGYLLSEEEPVQNPASDEQIKGWLETYGVGVNMNTGIMQFAADSFRNGPPPNGNWRGPARWAPDGSGGEQPGVGEYSVQVPVDGRYEPRIRHRFSAGIIEYNPFTGGLGWMELVNDPSQIDYVFNG